MSGEEEEEPEELGGNGLKEDEGDDDGWTRVSGKVDVGSAEEEQKEVKSGEFERGISDDDLGSPAAKGVVSIDQGRLMRLRKG
ncbi:unnamed protein product [Linum trigynum]|uniref:Uncharacterized protein n=1 Tax=Linum trigynum TaxID=586398 RepID=A0AAV2E706_9ROSI